MSNRRAGKAAREAVPEPWPLPAGWWWERLADLGDWVGGGTPSKLNPEFWTDGSIPWVSPKDMKRAEISASMDTITSKAVEHSAVKLVPAGSVLCVMRSGILAHSFPVATNSVDVTVNQDMRALCPRYDVNPHYIAHYLRYSRQLILNACRKQGTTVASIESSRIDAFPVPMYELSVQRHLVERIGEDFAMIDDGETALARARANLEVYRRSLLKAAVTGELTADWRAANPPQETGAALLARILADRREKWHANARNRQKQYREPDAVATDNLPPLHDGWTWATLEQLAFISGGVTVDSKRSPVGSITVPYLRVANVQRGWLDLNHVKSISIAASALNDLRVQPGDMLLNEGGDRDKVGRGWIFEGQISDCIHQNHIFKARPASTIVSPHYVMNYLNEFGRRFFIEQGRQTTNLASISLRKISSVPIPVPPQDERQVIMHRFASGLVEAQDDADLITASDQVVGQLRQSILAAAFRGQLTP